MGQLKDDMDLFIESQPATRIDLKSSDDSLSKSTPSSPARTGSEKRTRAASVLNSSSGPHLQPPQIISPDISGEEFDTIACRAAFLHMFVTLLGDYKDHLLFPSLAPNKTDALEFDDLFDSNNFLGNAPKDFKEFLSLLIRTQAFARFVDERTYSSPRQHELDFFDECSRYEQEVCSIKSKLKFALFP